jgi:hypothetical protein
MEYLEKAGEQALAASANREAAGFFARAIKLAEMARSMLARGRIATRWIAGARDGNACWATRA